MIIDARMNLNELAERMGSVATQTDAQAMRELLVARYAGQHTDDVPEAAWLAMLDQVVSPNTPKAQPNHWTRGGQAKTSDVMAATTQFLETQPAQTHPVGKRPLIAYQVGDYDIVAAFYPEGAIAVLCEQTGQDPSEYYLSEVELVSDKHLDSLEVFDQDEGKTETLKTSLRQDIAALTQPRYMYGWE